jgi:hypothetical protein
MDRAYLRHTFLHHKAFLHQLYQQKNVLKLLNHASDEELNLLLKLLHLVAVGVLPLSSQHQEIMHRSKREKKLMEFESKTTLRSALAAERDSKLKLIKQFAKLYAVFCHNLFNADH